MKRLTKHQIIDETIKHYSNNPRAVNECGNNCVYLTEDGITCAHSRCLTDEARMTIVNEGRTTSTATVIIEKYGDEIHKEQYRGHNETFWRSIQRLHDLTSHWDENGLTKRGQDYVKYIKSIYN